MSAIYKNGIAYGGAASAANLISATSASGGASNVQAQLNSLNDDLANNYAPIGADKVIIIETGADLNNYMTPGLYRAGPDADIPGYANCPATVTFIMYVIQRNYDRPVQIIIDNQANEFIRSKASATRWTEWSPSPKQINNDLVDNLQIPIKKITKTNTSHTFTYTVPNNSRHFVVAMSGFSGVQWVGTVFSTASGVITAREITKGGQITDVTTSTNSITIQASASDYLYAADFVISGNPMS